MQIHEHIVHHVRKHKEKIIAHVKKHHSKYLVGAGVLGGMAVYKFIGMIAIFFGMTVMSGGTIGADYYDDEYYAQEAAKKINISTNTGCEKPNTDETFSGGSNCPIE